MGDRRARRRVRHGGRGGAGVDRYKLGDKVFGCIGGCGKQQGTLADFAMSDSDLIAHAPGSIPLIDCAALPLVTITACEGLEKLGDLKNQHLLVHGATGGVGHIVVQLAKVGGTTVSATVGSDRKAALAQQLGADNTINYKYEPVERYTAALTAGQGFDAVFDTVGGSNIATSVQASKLNGRVACIQGRDMIDGGLLHARGVSLHLVFMLILLLHGVDRERHGAILERAQRLVDPGDLKPLIDDRRFTFDQIANAHAYAESGKHIGKVLVLHPDHA